MSRAPSDNPAPRRMSPRPRSSPAQSPDVGRSGRARDVCHRASSRDGFPAIGDHRGVRVAETTELHWRRLPVRLHELGPEGERIAPGCKTIWNYGWKPLTTVSQSERKAAVR